MILLKYYINNLAESFYNEFNGPELADFSWDNKKLGSQIVLYEITGKNSYKNTVREGF